MAEALAAAGLPVACRLPDRSPGVALVARLLDVVSPRVGEPFARRAVVDLLAVAPVVDGGVTAEDEAFWLDEAREAGVVAGREQWAERVPLRRRSLAAAVERLEAGADVLHGDDDGDTGRLEQARRRLRAARALETSVLRLTAAAADLPERGPWATWASGLARLVAAVFAPEPAAAAQDVTARLLALEVLGDTVDLRTAADTLRDLLSGETVQKGRVGRDGVAVLTPLELRGLSFSTVVFTGLAEGGFPVQSASRPDPGRRRAARGVGVPRRPAAARRRPGR